MGRVAGKVAVITGGARGQGRAHAIGLAREGADIVICDLAEQLETVPYPLASEQDLKETVSAVEAVGGRCIAVKADVRRRDDMTGVADAAVDAFGQIDILVANAGIAPVSTLATEDDAAYRDTFDINVKGVLHACQAVAPHMISRGSGGSIVVTASVGGTRAVYQILHYGMSKFAVMGLMYNLSAELAPHSIRVNAVLPGVVQSPMTMNDTHMSLFAGKPTGGTVEEMARAAETVQLLPVPWVQPEDISNAVIWLASDESRFVTGVGIPIDCGQSIQPAGIPPVGMARILQAEAAAAPSS